MTEIILILTQHCNKLDKLYVCQVNTFYTVLLIAYTQAHLKAKIVFANVFLSFYPYGIKS